MVHLVFIMNPLLWFIGITTDPLRSLSTSPAFLQSMHSEAAAGVDGAVAVGGAAIGAAATAHLGVAGEEFSERDCSVVEFYTERFAKAVVGVFV